MNADPSRASMNTPILRAFAERLLRLAAEITQPPLPYDDHDHLGFMTLCFVSKQMEHLRSVCMLIDAGRDRDAALIARSMVEGLGLLLWAALKPTERPLLWRSYVWVEDWRLLQTKEAAGEDTETSQKLEIQAQLDGYGHQFLTRKAKRRIAAGHPLPSDPYRPNWAGVTIADVLREVGGLPLYESIYRQISGWIHWSPGAIGMAIERNQGSVGYVEADPESAATALAAGFQALFETVRELDAHFECGFADRLTELRDDLLTQLGIA